MDMPGYLSEIRHAVESMIPLVWAERTTVEALQAEVARLTRTTQQEYNRAEAIAMDAEDPDDVMHASAMKWGTYFGSDKERYAAQAQVDVAQARLAARQFSLSALAGSLLQYGKQGISVVHQGVAACPPGRALGNQTLRDVIWQGRNQALHWEDGRFSEQVKDCFDGLSNSVDPKFSTIGAGSLAFEVVVLVNWKSFADFERDLLSLG
jgi:hypothetical protein